MKPSASAPGSCGPSEYVAPTVDCSATPSHPAGVPNCSTVGLGRNPHNLSEAYHYVKENYMRRQRFVQYDGPGGGTHSTPGYSYFTHEPARWGSKLVGFEVGENIENAQTLQTQSIRNEDISYVREASARMKLAARQQPSSLVLATS